MIALVDPNQYFIGNSMLLHKHTVFHGNFYYLITLKHNGMFSIWIILVHYLFMHV